MLLTVFVMAFVDTLGSLIGLSARAGFLDEHGQLPQIERPMLADAIATTVAGLIGTTTSGAYIESATGIAAGGRTGLTAVVTATAVRGGAVLRPVHHRDSGRRLQPRLDRGGTAHAGADLENQLRRLHGDDPGASR